MRKVLPGQVNKFLEAARELGCDEDEAAFDEKLRAIGGHKAEPATNHLDQKGAQEGEEDTPKP